MCLAVPGVSLTCAGPVKWIPQTSLLSLCRERGRCCLFALLTCGDTTSRAYRCRNGWQAARQIARHRYPCQAANTAVTRNQDRHHRNSSPPTDAVGSSSSPSRRSARSRSAARRRSRARSCPVAEPRVGNGVVQVDQPHLAARMAEQRQPHRPGRAGDARVDRRGGDPQGGGLPGGGQRAAGGLFPTRGAEAEGRPTCARPAPQPAPGSRPACPRAAVYDVIVVGARCARGPIAMLLAWLGYMVLLVDRVAFPSDTSGIRATGGPAVRRSRRVPWAGSPAATPHRTPTSAAPRRRGGVRARSRRGGFPRPLVDGRHQRGGRVPARDGFDEPGQLGLAQAAQAEIRGDWLAG